MLDVTVAPESATLKVNGDEKTLEAGGKYGQETVFESEVTLLVEKAGYTPVTKVVTIKANNDDNKHSITLAKANVRFDDLPLQFTILSYLYISSSCLM